MSNTPTRMRADCTNGSGSFLSQATSRRFTCAGCRPLQVNAPDRKVVGTRYDDCPGSTDLALAVPDVARRQLCPAGLADRPRSAWPARFPPRVRARELWRPDDEYLAEAQDDATLVAIRSQERAGPRHHHRRRDPARELLQPLRHGVGRGRHRQPRRGAGSQRPPQPGPARRRDRSAVPHPVQVRDTEFLRANTDRTIKVTVPGPFTMSQQAQNDYYRDAEALAMAYAEACNAEIKDLFAAGADIVQLDEPYLQARPEAARELRRGRAEPGARRSRRARRPSTCASAMPRSSTTVRRATRSCPSSPTARATRSRSRPRSRASTRRSSGPSTARR